MSVDIGNLASRHIGLTEMRKPVLWNAAAQTFDECIIFPLRAFRLFVVCVIEYSVVKVCEM